MDYNKIEDAVFKKAMEIFKDSAAEFFNLDIELDRPAETEIKNIDIKTNAMDYLFYTISGDYVHFEFQTTKKRDDISIFLYYDASLHYKSKRKIRTIVIYSSEINDVNTYINCGSIKYSIEAFYMNQLNGDEKLKEIQFKIKNNIELTQNDIMALSFIPLMNNKINKSDIIIKSIEVAQEIPNNNMKNNTLMLLYALFDKFGDEKSKNKFKEVIVMTEIGKMIYNDGLQEGMEKGMEKAKSEMLIKQLIKKFNKLPDDYKLKIKRTSNDTLDVLLTEIFDMESINDLDKYLN